MQSINRPLFKSIRYIISKLVHESFIGQFLNAKVVGVGGEGMSSQLKAATSPTGVGEEAFGSILKVGYQRGGVPKWR